MKRTIVLKVQVRDDVEYGEVAARLAGDPAVIDFYCSTTTRRMQAVARNLGLPIRFTSVRLRDSVAR